MNNKSSQMLSKILFWISALIFVVLISFWFINADILSLSQIDLRWVLAILTFGLFLIAAFISYYEYHGFGTQAGIVRRGKEKRQVAITFDDGPSPKYTPKILDILKEKEVKATFFVLGKHVQKYPNVAKRIVLEGHDIGNHTFSHKELVRSTRKTILNELDKTNALIKKVTGEETNLFRPPRGIHSRITRQLLIDLGYKIILWSVSTVDWRGSSPKYILKRVQKYAKNGSIILFHDSGALVRPEGGARGNTVLSLPLVIDYLLKAGFEIVPISKMIKLRPSFITKNLKEELIKTQAL